MKNEMDRGRERERGVGFWILGFWTGGGGASSTTLSLLVGGAKKAKGTRYLDESQSFGSTGESVPPHTDPPGSRSVPPSASLSLPLEANDIAISARVGVISILDVVARPLEPAHTNKCCHINVQCKTLFRGLLFYERDEGVTGPMSYEYEDLYVIFLCRNGEARHLSFFLFCLFLLARLSRIALLFFGFFFCFLFLFFWGGFSNNTYSLMAPVGKAPHIKVFTGNVIHLSTTTSSHPSLHSSCCSHGLVHRHQVLHFHWRLRTHRDTHRRAENGVEEILGPRVSDTNERRTSLSGNQTKGKSSTPIGTRNNNHKEREREEGGDRMAVHSSRRSAEICAESHYSIIFIFNFLERAVDKGLHYDIIIFLIETTIYFYFLYFSTFMMIHSSSLASFFFFLTFNYSYFPLKMTEREIILTSLLVRIISEQKKIYIYIYIYIYKKENRGTGLQYRCIRGSDNSVYVLDYIVFM
eukprot:gene2436-1533_t